MTEPTRLFSTPESELERALLDAGRSYKAPGSTRAKTLLALGLASAPMASSAPAAAATSRSVSKAAFGKAAVTVFLLGAVAVPLWRYLHQHTSDAPVARPPAVAAASVLPAPPTRLEHARTETAPAEPLPVEPAPSSALRNKAIMRAEVKSGSTPPLAAELAALETARTSLSHSDPAAALVALDAYGRNFPRGRLKIEAEVLRIGALSKSGQSEAARKRAEAFLQLHPDSVLASRVRSYAGL